MWLYYNDGTADNVKAYELGGVVSVSAITRSRVNGVSVLGFRFNCNKT